MPHDLPLPATTPDGWVVKIYDRELPEEPHATVRFKTKVWRVSLRTGRVLDSQPPSRALDASVLAHVRANLTALGAAWNRLHPHMPVQSAPKPKKTKRRSKEE